MTLPEEYTVISEEEIMAISKELMRKNHKAYAALAGFPDESDEDEQSQPEE